MRAIAVLAIVLVTSGCRELNPDFAGNGTEDSAGTTVDASTSSSGTSTSGAMTTSTSGTMSSSDATTSSSSSSSSSSSEGSSESSSSSSSGSTTSGCPDDLTDCFGNCVDLMTNHNNCGDCGISCHPVQETCVEGLCTPD